MITAIIQARVGSTRLPNKVFAELGGRPLISHVVERVMRARNVAKVVLATTVNPLDDPLADWARAQGVALHRGSEEDVLARFHGAAVEHGASVVVRITADDPFKDPRVIDQVIQLLQDRGAAFCYNNKPPTFPEGLDTEVFTFEALDAAHREASEAFDREHVTQYLYRHPERFPQANLTSGQELSHLRWTIDTEPDLAMARAVYDALYAPGKVFLMEDILALLKERPGIATLNKNVTRSAMYNSLPKERVDEAIH